MVDRLRPTESSPISYQEYPPQILIGKVAGQTTYDLRGWVLPLDDPAVEARVKNQTSQDGLQRQADEICTNVYLFPPKLTFADNNALQAIEINSPYKPGAPQVVRLHSRLTESLVHDEYFTEALTDGISAFAVQAILAGYLEYETNSTNDIPRVVGRAMAYDLHNVTLPKFTVNRRYPITTQNYQNDFLDNLEKTAGILGYELASPEGFFDRKTGLLKRVAVFSGGSAFISPEFFHKNKVASHGIRHANEALFYLYAYTQFVRDIQPSL